jgi:hypothetical protein
VITTSRSTSSSRSSSPTAVGTSATTCSRWRRRAVLPTGDVAWSGAATCRGARTTATRVR